MTYIMIKVILNVFLLSNCLMASTPPSAKGYKNIDVPKVPLARSKETHFSPKSSKTVTSLARPENAVTRAIQRAFEEHKPREVSKILKENPENVDIYAVNYDNKRDLIAEAYFYRRRYPRLFVDLFELPNFQVNRIRYDGQTILQFLIGRGDIQMLRVLFDHFRDTIDCNKTSSLGLLPLYTAAENESVLNFLLDHAPGLDVTAVDAYGFSFFEEALNSGNFKLVKKMINRPETRKIKF